MITLPTQPLRTDHARLLPQIEQLRVAADSLGYASSSAVRQQVEEAYRFLTERLLPHAQAEEAHLYPAVAAAMGAAEATRTMTQDHVEIAAMVHALGLLQMAISDGISLEQEMDLRRLLYGLYTLVRVHFLKEEKVYLPVLDAALDAESIQRLFTAMEPIGVGD